VCTAEAISAKVFKLLHYTEFSSIRTLEAVRYVALANNLEIEVSAQVLKNESVIYNTCETLAFLLLFQFRTTSLWAVIYLL
jgi:hypothetical protein